MENTQNVDREISQFQYLREQRDILRGQFEINNAAINNLLTIKTTVENIKDLKSDEEILLPLGGIVSIKATLKDVEKLLVNISQDIIVEKSIEETIDYVDKQLTGYNEHQKLLREQIQKLELSLEGINQSIQNRMNQG